MGGVVSATQNLAGALAERHEVEIVALRKVRDESYFPLDPQVTVRSLTDLRPYSPVSDVDDPLADRFTLVYPPNTGVQKPVVSRLAEKRLLEYLATTDADVVVSSNPRITVLLAHAQGDFLRVAQEHSMPLIYADDMKKKLFPAYLHLDALTALTPEEADSIAGQVPGVRDRLAVMPNCVPAAPVRSRGTGKMVISAGHLTDNKNHLLLVEAFAQVHAEAPDWTLRIYGSGAEKARLRARIHELGLSNHVLLMGPAAPVTPEFGKGSLFVLPSKREAFGNVLVEAMAAGLPVVSTDADHGPRNVLTDGEDGLIVPCGDVDAMASAVLRLVRDDELRRKMAEAAVRGAERFQETASRERFEEILAQAYARKELPRDATARVDDEGSLHIAVGPLPASAEGAEVVLRKEGKTPEERRFPLTPGGEALVPWDGGLPQGTWQLALTTPAGAEVPLSADGFGCDTRDLLAVRLPRTEGPALALLLPHRDQDGRLRVRSVLRATHAEAGDIEADERTLRVRAALWGAAVGEGAVLEAVHRRDKKRVLVFPLQDAGDGTGTAVVDCAALAGEHTGGTGSEIVWDFWVRPAAGAARVALAKLATDVLSPIDVFVLPRPVLVTQEAVAGALQERSFSLGERALREAKRVLRPAPRPQPEVRRRETELRPYFTLTGQFAVKTVRL
ncbi:glycosyltransferase family 4 protein [Streptomyces seoulensis]|uniref:D-inositol 3-phosphate glycosyltransferase n=2 Tax=Streptomyces seoulensis TaxID=73044 RepID=A0A4P6U4G9_STRSO|nr:glycosyltransferase family 4 protein [Streptomyces seoulensis]